MAELPVIQPKLEPSAPRLDFLGEVGRVAGDNVGSACVETE